MPYETLDSLLVLAILIGPIALVTFMGITMLAGFSVSESAISRFTFSAIVSGLVGTLCSIWALVWTQRLEIVVELGNWVSLPDEHVHFHFTVKFLLDRLSLPFLLLVFLLCGTVSSFASKYMHREPGFRRFHLLFALFTLGMVLATIGGTIEVLFFGWELVGISSALLVGFYHDRKAPVNNGLRVWTTYRLSDAAFLMAAIALHHQTGAGDLDRMAGAGAWPYGVSELQITQAFWVGTLLLIAAAGKSALIPFSGWLPRAMEGPTPSSAIFYGALSVHLGAFLLLRVSPIISSSWLLTCLVVIVGLATAVSAAFIARVQADVKSALAYASLTQVGLIVMEIGLGLYWLALIHIIGHASLRTLQLLRAPSVLRDYFNIETALGRRLAKRVHTLEPSHTRPAQIWLYRFAFERAYLDVFLDRWIVAPFVNFFRQVQRIEESFLQHLTNLASQSVGPQQNSDELLHDESAIEHSGQTHFDDAGANNKTRQFAHSHNSTEQGKTND
ncbi:MAG TPA: proton-conducting transporter membrane subunit [Pirellulaceae bacterium]|nr:proton-conducting transporter membrane subunit [Pirellulaceae bacterium]HMO92545.1 proton-conducting transporter membrane subunit [Pirellulaceae bacterium]HMP68973.1 proton-conducting transporter membrane subunit [Pirellulaceae bacterium]